MIHQKDKIRDINDKWSLAKSKYTAVTAEYQAFKIYYTKKLRRHVLDPGVAKWYISRTSF